LEQEPYREAIEVVLNFAAEMRGKYGFQLSELGIGGGFAIQYERNLPPPTIAGYAQEIASTLIAKSRDLALKPPRLVIEPGRAIVGRAGVAIYSVGGIKDVPGVRKYILVDGGMGDNIRPALYGSRYEALVANKAESSVEERVTIAGKFCESGDVLIQDIELPKISIGDIIAIPACGAYCLPLASNYNLSLKPAIVLLKEGKARLSRRRETYQDIARCDLT
jgi:diaminopimelate decarboxylase